MLRSDTEPVVNKKHTSSDKRAGERLEHPVLVAYRSVDRFLADFGSGLSTSGVFVHTRTLHPEGTTVRLLISIPDGDVPVEITGRVARVQPEGPEEPPGMGIEFVDVDPEVTERLATFVDALRDRLEGGDAAE